MTKTIALSLLAASALALSACDSGNNTGPVSDAPLEQIAAPNDGDWTTVVSQTSSGGFLMGNPDAPVKLVEFASLTCPACKAFEEAAGEELVNTYVKSGQVSYEFRNYVLNGLDLSASILARCGGESSFFGLMRQMYLDQQNWSGQIQTASPEQLQRVDALPANEKPAALAELAGLKQWVAMRGLPTSKAEQCLADSSNIDRLVQMRDQAIEQFDVSGTPTFVLDGERLDLDVTEAPWPQIERALRNAIG